ncbi:MAG: allophanate hydrolase subunit 1 [Pseudomonadota bacterium]
MTRTLAALTQDLRPMGDQGIMVVFGEEISPECHREVVAAEKAVMASNLPGVTETIPAYAALYVGYDALATDFATLRDALLNLSLPQTDAETGKVWTVPICYDPEFAPDLEEVANWAGKNVDDVISAHLESLYRVYMFGFAPGYAYLGGSLPEIQVPRRDAPRQGIPKGSVMIAGPQCLMCPLVMPSGWSVIGRTPMDLLARDAMPPSPFNIGDEVRFTRISRSDYDAVTRA